MSKTIDYYNKNAQKFTEGIAGLKPPTSVIEFFNKISKGGKILDAGCCNGRYSVMMLNQGYEVYAFDASISLVKFAIENTGLDVKVDTFEDVKYENEEFDGIFAMASLLHVAKKDMSKVFDKLYNFLKKKDTCIVHIS